MLEHGLQAIDSSIPLISEEDGAGDNNPPAGIYWLVDPLDGKQVYLWRDGQFTVNIALAGRGEVLAGVIYAPEAGRTYLAVRGEGG